MSTELKPLPANEQILTEAEVEALAQEWTNREGTTAEDVIRHIERVVVERMRDWS